MQWHVHHVAGLSKTGAGVTASGAGAVQACMYRAMPAEERAAKLKQLSDQLAVLEGMVTGPYVLGDMLSGADAAVFPTLVFMDNMLPAYFGWDLWSSRPNLLRYYKTMKVRAVLGLRFVFGTGRRGGVRVGCTAGQLWVYRSASSGYRLATRALPVSLLQQDRFGCTASCHGATVRRPKPSLSYLYRRTS